MNKKYLQENNLMQMHKQFMRLCEYVSAVPLTEEGEEEEDPTMVGGDDPNAAPQGGDPNMMGDDPTMGGQDPNAAPQGGDPNMMGDDPTMGGEMPPMEDPTMGGQDPNGMGEENEVIDVEDITDAQEKTNDKGKFKCFKIFMFSYFI